MEEKNIRKVRRNRKPPLASLDVGLHSRGESYTGSVLKLKRDGKWASKDSDRPGKGGGGVVGI